MISATLCSMKSIAALALALSLATPAFAQAPLEAGAMVDSFEMIPDRTVIFAPQADGKLRIIKVTDKDRLAPMPRNPGEVAIAMTYALEIGAVIEFNSGLDYAFTYAARATGSGDAVPLSTCPVRGDAVAQDQWPQGFKSIVIGPLTRLDGPIVCEHPAN